ncbi:radical SAM protein [Thermococcus sp.]|uniref:radical SAM/SPASM domain-containing protein n=1 Tax=Thermococcus sp. TaxID=35749 RepID=UPI00262FF6B1|nr:radical SAM protein [Thermococcus sp.]
MSGDVKPELYTFHVGGKFFVLHPPTGTLFEVDKKTYDFCRFVTELGWSDAKERFVMEYSESDWDSLINEIKSDESLRRVFFEAKPPVKPYLGAMKSKISSLSLNVMEDCNFECVYCYGDGGTYHTPNTRMSPEVGKRAIDLLMREGKNVVNLQFFGGEPLLNFPLIRELVHYAKGKAEEYGKTVTFSITTNGYLITDKVIDFFLENNFTVTLSFDGPREVQNHNRPLRGGFPTFDVVVKNARKMLERGVKVSVRATILPEQIGRYYEIYRFFVDFGFRSVHLEPATTSTPLTKEHAKLIESALEKIAKDELEHYKEKGIVYTKLREMVHMIYSGTYRHYPCGVARSYFGVSADGKMYPCHRFFGMEEFVVGHVDDFRWENEFIQKILRHTVDRRPNCSNCPIRAYCGGGCIYNNHYYNGDIFLPDEFHCAYMFALVKWGSWLYSNLDENWLDKVFSRSPLRGVRAEESDEAKTQKPKEVIESV